MGGAPESELSRPVELARLARPRSRHRIEANPEEMAALARRFGALAIEGLSAEIQVEFVPGDQVLRVTGHVSALVRQACIVTLDPVENIVTAELDEMFAREVDDGKELDLIADDPTGWAEPWPGDYIDLGELAAQNLALAIDPYPRKAGAEIATERGGEDAGRSRPFAGLGGLGRPGRA
jgi:uncharacterized metal-binding protein YceD (DUF177 family)